ncbi:nitrile hydratase accessory protein [Azospirillum endophyticum]
MDDPASWESLRLPRDESGPLFEKPWQAEAFALVVELYKGGRFTWPEWVDLFSAEIKASPAMAGESVNDAYYRQWWAALERMVSSRGLVAKGEIPARAEEWRRAYLNTPHGQPILLANAACRPPAEHDHHHGRHHAPARRPAAVAAPIPR